MEKKKIEEEKNRKELKEQLERLKDLGEDIDVTVDTKDH